MLKSGGLGVLSRVHGEVGSGNSNSSSEPPPRPLPHRVLGQPHTGNSVCRLRGQGNACPERMRHSWGKKGRESQSSRDARAGKGWRLEPSTPMYRRERQSLGESRAGAEPWNQTRGPPSARHSSGLSLGAVPPQSLPPRASGCGTGRMASRGAHWGAHTGWWGGVSREGSDPGPLCPARFGQGCEETTHGQEPGPIPILEKKTKKQETITDFASLCAETRTLAC